MEIMKGRWVGNLGSFWDFLYVKPGERSREAGRCSEGNKGAGDHVIFHVIRSTLSALLSLAQPCSALFSLGKGETRCGICRVLTRDNGKEKINDDRE